MPKLIIFWGCPSYLFFLFIYSFCRLVKVQPNCIMFMCWPGQLYCSCYNTSLYFPLYLFYWCQGSHSIEKPGKSQECWNSVFLVGKVWKKSGIQSFLTLKAELGHYATYRNGRPLFGKCSSKEIQTCMFSLSKAKKNRWKMVKIDNIWYEMW